MVGSNWSVTIVGDFFSLPRNHYYIINLKVLIQRNYTWFPSSFQVSSWWFLNQPILKNMRGCHNGTHETPQFSGWTFQKYLSCHHLDLFINDNSSTAQKKMEIMTTTYDMCCFLAFVLHVSFRVFCFEVVKLDQFSHVGVNIGLKTRNHHATFFLCGPEESRLIHWIYWMLFLLLRIHSGRLTAGSPTAITYWKERNLIWTIQTSIFGHVPAVKVFRGVTILNE